MHEIDENLLAYTWTGVPFLQQEACEVLLLYFLLERGLHHSGQGIVMIKAEKPRPHHQQPKHLRGCLDQVHASWKGFQDDGEQFH